MSSDPLPDLRLRRRRFLGLAGAGGLASALPLLLPTHAGAVPPSGEATARATAPVGWLTTDSVAMTYHRTLLRHTRWSETQWSDARGWYSPTDFGFAVVLGHAVLLTRGEFDADEAGIDAATLESRTLATIRHFASSHRLTGGTEWGQRLFFDTTFQLYFVLAAHLLWDRLDLLTQSRIDTIARAQAQYTTALGTDDDPLSGSWTPDGLTGGYRGDTKLEEMGVYAQSLAPGLAWAADDPRAGEWRAAYGRWSRNETGLPVADRANPSEVDGVAVSANTAHNIYDTFAAENHGSFGPHYQSELWRTSGRNAAHFITSGVPMPEVLTRQPNGDRLWATLLQVMSDAGEPLMPMVDDREHLYGRDVIPLAFLAQVLGDRAAARCEINLAERLLPYLDYPPTHRLTKFSGEPKYEPEARAEVAISLLLHEWRAGQRERVRPLTDAALTTTQNTATDLGAELGLVSHRTASGWAGAVSKAGFVKFAWQPGHDDWFFDLGGSAPAFFPSTSVTVTGRQARVYRASVDGFRATATVLTLPGGRAGLVTLPGGSIVISSSGTSDAEGVFGLHNLTMPGMPGLIGSRTFAHAGGVLTVPATDAGAGGGLPAGVARRDVIDLSPVTARHVRMLGVTPAATYGYSVVSLEVRAAQGGSDLARGRVTTASSSDTGRQATLATDGDSATRWAVSRADRTRADSWLAVDLGSAQTIAEVLIDWEAAAGRLYRIQTSDDGVSWIDRATHPTVLRTRSWLGIDDRVGFVVRGGTNPIEVAGTTITLSAGPAAGSAGMVVEGHPSVRSTQLATLAAVDAPIADVAGVTASRLENHLSVFNLTDAAVRPTVTLTDRESAVPAHQGISTVGRDTVRVQVAVSAAAAVVLPCRATVIGAAGTRPPTGLQIEVVDAATVRLSGADASVVVQFTGGDRVAARVTRGRVTQVRGSSPRWPLADLALERTTFPTSPLPEGMTSPAYAVDGDARTTWTCTGRGRMVVDLGVAADVGQVEVQFAANQAYGAIEVSTDGATYLPVRVTPGSDRISRATVNRTVRYVALTVQGGIRPAVVQRLSVLPR